MYQKCQKVTQHRKMTFFKKSTKSAKMSHKITLLAYLTFFKKCTKSAKK